MAIRNGDWCRADLYDQRIEADLGRRRGHKLWVALDQAASSATNFAGAALAAGLLGARDFGAWATVYTGFLVVLTATRSVVGDVMLITLPALDTPRWNRLAAGAISTGLVVGLGSACGVALTAPLFSDEVRTAAWSIAAFLPFALWHDATRYALFARRSAGLALLTDVVWLLLAVLGLMVLRLTDTDSLSLSVVVYAGAVVPAAFLGAALLRLRPSWSAARDWYASARPLATRIGAEYVVYTLSSITMVIVVLGAAEEVTAVGAVRAAQTVMGPVSVVFAATTIYTQPLMVNRLANGQPVRRLTLVVTAGNCTIAAAWCGLALLVPRRYGVRLFGATWDAGRELLLVTGTMFVVAGLTTGASMLLRSRLHVSESLRARTIALPVVVTASVAGAAAGGAFATLVAFTVASTLVPALLWLAVLRNPGAPRLSTSIREREASRPPR